LARVTVSESADKSWKVAALDNQRTEDAMMLSWMPLMLVFPTR
jgi:hypothetical protein